MLSYEGRLSTPPQERQEIDAGVLKTGLSSRAAGKCMEGNPRLDIEEIRIQGTPKKRVLVLSHILIKMRVSLRKWT